MGDSACLMHGFSYASAIPNQSNQGNPMRVLGESVSFGRFMSESEPLSWEKWSTFSHKRYVEEAARYAQPGSVAQKKAFFEAHYKKIAAQKAAAEAEAAALLEQQNAARAESERFAQNAADHEQEVIFNDTKNSSVDAISGNEDSDKRVSVSFSENLENQMERPLLKESCVGSEDTDISSATSKKKSGLSSLKSSIRRKTWNLPSTPVKPVTPHFKKENNVSQSVKKSNMESIDKKRPSPKSLCGPINIVPIKEPDKELVSVAKKAASSGLPPIFSRTPKDCKTPLRTPNMTAAKGVAKYSVSTPRSENIRMKTPIDPSDPGSKTAAPKWQVLSNVYTKSLTACRNKLQSPASSTPFMLRTEERAAKRKQKLEGKFNTNEEQKVQLQKTFKEKAGNEIRKLSYCFKARPLPDFYKDRESSINQMCKKSPATRPQTEVLGRSNSKKQQDAVSMPPPPPPPNAMCKNGATQPQTAVLGRSNSKKQQDTVSMPPPPPPPNAMSKNGATLPQTAVLGRSNSKKQQPQQQRTVSIPPSPPPANAISKNGASKNPSKKKAANPTKLFPSSLPRRATHENKSPNIQTLNRTCL